MSTEDWRDIPRDRYSAAANHADDVRLLESLMANSERLDENQYEVFGNMRDKLRHEQNAVLNDRRRRWAEQTAEALGIRFELREM